MPSSRQFQLQGPCRPPALKVASKNSHGGMKKKGMQAPVIIHVRAPKVIHARPQEFMSLVQRLTGKNASSTCLPSHSSEASSEWSDGSSKERDPSLLLTLGQSPYTNACLQDFGLLF